MVATPSADESNATLLGTIAKAQAPRPKNVRPVIIIGAGGIVRDAHLPAYRKAGFPVIGLLDKSPEKAEELALQQGIQRTFHSIADAVAYAPADTVFDIAVPASQLISILPQLPSGAAVLMQKPMGETIDEARAIRDLCRGKNFIAAVMNQVGGPTTILCLTVVLNTSFFWTPITTCLIQSGSGF